MPVLPLVGSRMTRSRVSTPSRSASASIWRAIRSFTEPVGLWPSSLAKMRTPGFGLKPGSSTSGVWPIDSARSRNSIWLPDDLSAAGHSRQDRDGVAAPDRSLQLAQVADVFVVDVDVDELAQLTIRAEQALAETGIALGQVFEHLAD